MLDYAQVARWLRARSGRIGVVAVGVFSLSACVATENLVTDLISSEGQLPSEALTHKALTNEELMIFGQPGLKQFEIARRFESGAHGFPVRLDCALTFYRLSGSTRTVLREDRAAGGSGQRITYLGFPPARAAARRLDSEGVVEVPAETTCLSAIQPQSR